MGVLKKEIFTTLKRINGLIVVVEFNSAVLCCRGFGIKFHKFFYELVVAFEVLLLI